MCILWLYPQISSRYFPGKQSGDQVCPIVMQDPPITRTIHYWHNEDIQEQYHPTMVDVAFHVFNMYQLYVEYASIFILFHMSYFHIFPFISQHCDNFSKMWPPLFHIHMYTVYKYIYNYFINIFSVHFHHFLRFPIHGYTYWYIHSYRKKVVDNVYSKCPIIFYPRSRFSNTYSIPIHEQQQVSTFIPIKTPKLMVENYVCSRSKMTIYWVYRVHFQTHPYHIRLVTYFLLFA
jgi:hypothetical protein